ncbi:F-box protein SKIP23-like [Melia azedarach]|uniref:F-box protein SKIP23-like n=1 Tax=Melia azedarach TaxID=155640 RepID=A0ACC1XRP5_MELAZ|nr:F-box protein SKIP23-like [Melia azedarach]
METELAVLLFIRSLPRDLQHEILKRLERPQILCFRAASKHFRNTLSLPPKPISPHPDLVIPFCIHPDSSLPRQLLLTISTVYAIQRIETTSDDGDPANTWIVRVEELSSGVVRVKETLYRFVDGVPSHQLPRSLNLLDYRVRELSKVFGLVPAASEKYRKYVYFGKVVLSSYPDEFDSGFTILALCGKGSVIAWRKGDDFWTYIKIEGSTAPVHFQDIVYYNNKFYAVCYPRRVITVDPLTLKVTELDFEITRYFPTLRGNNFLVKSSKDLFWICKEWQYLFGNYPFEDPNEYRTRVDVLKLDEKNNKWVEVSDELGNEALFIGEKCSFSLSGKGYTPCKQNSVYFVDEQLSEIGNCPGRDIGISKIGDFLATPIFAFPGYSKLFWPPPAWLICNQTSASNPKHE